MNEELGALSRLINDALARLTPRDPRFRYFETPDGRCFLWTTERFSDGKFGSAVLVPAGKGARSGRAAVTTWRSRREVHHSTRKAAKARALKLYQQHVAELAR